MPHVCDWIDKTLGSRPVTSQLPASSATARVLNVDNNRSDLRSAMPPANSPNDSPAPVPDETSPYLQQLEAISSPVPNFAATLMTPDEQDIDDANVSYLRTRFPDQSENEAVESESADYHTLRDWDSGVHIRQGTVRGEMSQEQRGQPERSPSSRARSTQLGLREISNRIQARRREVLSRQNRLHDADYNTNYANRTPQRQSLYDWAPNLPLEDDSNSAANVLRHGVEDDDLPSYASYARYRWLERRQRHEQAGDEQPSSRNSRQPRDEPSGRTTLSTLAEALRRETETLSSAHSLLQSVDRHRRTQSRAHARAAWQSYADSSTGPENDMTTSTRLHRSEQQHPSHHSSDTYIPSYSGTRHTLRKKFLDEPDFTHLKRTMFYLSGLRFCSSKEQALDLARSHRLFVPSQQGDDSSFLQLLGNLSPRESSWLVPGATFRGTQCASVSLPRSLMDDTIDDAIQSSLSFIHDDGILRDSSPPEQSTGLSVITASGRRYIADHAWDSGRSPSLNPFSDSEEPNSWPVTVTIDTLSLSAMTLSGTMSASRIRDKRSPTGESSSTTHFEGEIIDFETHTFETENFESEGLETDAMYWSRIGPFRGMKDAEVARCLLSREWVEENLVRRWILMRWKERSFIPPTPSPNPGGISIRGFYYIALHRQTGLVDGSYGNHPESQPFQRLRMRPCWNLDDEEEHEDEGLRESSGVGTNKPSVTGVEVGRKWWPAMEFR